MKTFFFILGLMLSWSVALHAQHDTVEGQVIQHRTKAPLPFAHIIINEGENHAFADIGGHFSLKNPTPIRTLTFSYPQYRTIHLQYSQAAIGKLNIELVPTHLFDYIRKTDEKTKHFVRNMLHAKELHDPQKIGRFRYKTYNKFYLTTEESEQLRGKLREIYNKINLFKKILDLPKIDHAHHLFITESLTERSYLNALNHKETILASRVSGIEKPLMLAMTSLMQPFSVYEDRLLLAGLSYHGPLISQALHRYRFQVIDSAIIDAQKIYVLKFNPRSPRNIPFLKGYLYINADDYSVRYANITPAIGSSVGIYLAQSYQKTETMHWFPEHTRTSLIIDDFVWEGVRIDAVAEEMMYDIQTDSTLHRKDFDEVILDYLEEKEQNNEDFWKKHRQIPFSEKDASTYVFYDSIGSIRNFERWARMGEGLFFGELPFYKFSLDIPRVFSFNRYEGIRLGLGFHTNERLSQRFTVGGYFGYGFDDTRFKYGLDLHIELLKHPQTNLVLVRSDDLHEAGGTRFVFDRYQFSSESTRLYRLNTFDRIIHNEGRLEFSLIRNLDLQVGLAQRKIDPLYQYFFDGNTGEQFDLTEFKAGIRFAYGELFIQSVHRKLSLGTRYPTYWLQFTKGIKSLLDGKYAYEKLDLKLQHTINYLGGAISRLQVEAGIIGGNVPYSLLYNGKGGFWALSAVTHNVFETMDYNEFLSDRHVAIFFSHNFGDIYLRATKKQPSIELVQSAGFGSLENPENHSFMSPKGFSFKTMEKGFYETGFFLNNIYVLDIFNINAGLGAGVFGRYGAYANPAIHDNLFFKIALDFQI